MGVTRIAGVLNAADFVATIDNLEHPEDTAEGRGVFRPGDVRGTNIWVPWCADGVDFAHHHIDVSMPVDGAMRRFTIWQSSFLGVDRVRMSTDGAWHLPGELIGGVAESGVFPEGRLLVIHNETLWLLPVVLWNVIVILGQVARGQGVICGDENPRPFAVPSVPRRSAAAFSMAGRPTEAFDRGQPDARFMYRDSGKRYEFIIVNGVVTVQPPSSVPRLREARSFDRKRVGETIPLPVFDMVAANGGRVFAKEKGKDRFFFATVDEMFIHAAPDGRELAVPSVYFKLDPEFNQPTASSRDLLTSMTGQFFAHPAAIRFPAYRFMALTSFMPSVVVRMKRGEWNLVDVRPPQGTLLSSVANAGADGFAAIAAIGGPLKPLVEDLRKFARSSADPAPPPGVPFYSHVTYCTGSNPPEPQLSIDFRRVLDIGVGHVHLHQQYERVTGGEMQTLDVPRTSDFFSDAVSVYQFMNGPIADADGFNDGTCNYYVLAELSNGSFGLMFIDEQTVFTPRWRLVDPSDTRGTSIPLVARAVSNPPLYRWSPDQFWSPFREGLVGGRSRMAVSAQVILVSGDREPDAIYSINFSWGTMDRSWRWRKGPSPAQPRFFDPAAVAAGDEPIASGAGNENTYYPQSIRLRDDMTLHLKGTRSGVIGRWYQRYLPASNQVVPSVSGLGGQRRPAIGYTHPWKFLREDLFQLADQFSHFGVYDEVDSRTQYYPVIPITDGDRQSLEAIAGSASDWWVDDRNQLTLMAYEFRADICNFPVSWSPPYPRSAMRPPSFYNPAAFLRIGRRGSRWLAFWRDKRDDDVELMDMSQAPSTVTLISRSRQRSVAISIGAGVRVAGPPAVRRVFVWISGAQVNVAFNPPAAAGPVFDNVFKVRMAILGASPGEKRILFDLVASDTFRLVDGLYQYQWTPASADLDAITQFANASGAAASGATVWFEGVGGHVAPPEDVAWGTPPVARVTVTPSEIATGIPATFSVHAVDAFTSQVLRGDVMLDGTVLGVTDAPITYTFESTRFSKPIIGTGPIDPIDPPEVSGPPTLLVPGYPEVQLPIKFVAPRKPRVAVDQTALPVGRPVQVTVRATHPTTGALVSGRVFINGADTAATNAPFTYTFGSAPPAGVVKATGYLDAPVPWPGVYIPHLTASIQPYPAPMNVLTTLTARVQDATTGALVDAAIKVNGTTVGRSNVPFSYKLIFARVREYDPELGGYTITLVPPTMVATAAGYPDVEVNLGVA